jgi:hypothetical protein
MLINLSLHLRAKGGVVPPSVLSSLAGVKIKYTKYTLCGMAVYFVLTRGDLQRRE